MKKEDCIFCKLANGEIPTEFIYEDEEFRVILDNDPVSKGHALVIPKEHYDNLYEIPEATVAKAMCLAKKMATKMTEKLHADGFNLLQNNNECAGQSVYHFHIHLIPRYKNDGQKITMKPIGMSAEEIKKIRDIIAE